MTVPCSASNSGIVDANAGLVWSVLVDWGALMDWYANDAANGLVPLLKTELEGRPDSLPLVRVMTMPDGTKIREALERRDETAFRIYYSLPNEGGMEGIRNYWATTFVEEISPMQCRVSCASFFDVVDAQRASEISAFFRDVVYARAVIGGLRQHCEALFRKKRAQMAVGYSSQ